MWLAIRPFFYFYHYIAYQIRLTKIRYRYSPYYAIGWLLSDIMLRLMLIILPLMLLLWETTNPSSLPQISNYPRDIPYNFAKDDMITIGGGNPLTIESDETVFIAQNHYHLRNGLINIRKSGQKIRSDDMLVQDDIIAMKDNVKLDSDAKDFELNTAQMTLNRNNETAMSDAKSYGFMKNYRFETIGFHYDMFAQNNIITMKDNVKLDSDAKNFELNTAQMTLNRNNDTAMSNEKSYGFMKNYRFETIGFHYKISPETLDLYRDAKFQSDKNTLIGKNGMVLAVNDNRLSINDVTFNDVEGTQMIASYAEGVFDDNITYLKELHFSGDFAYHWRDNLIMGEQAVIYFDETQTADYMVANGSIIATMPERDATAEQAYFNYATEQLEMCGNVEIITKRGRKITSPCAIFSLNEGGSFNLRQNKTYLK
ncbi:MAG: hypothetical protein K0U45_02860 [Alphaproteobacteria bacterium]|nr:hypothetical protein [Alphaproteobacteria bacterium]